MRHRPFANLFSSRLNQWSLAVGVSLFMLRLLQWAIPFPWFLLALLLQVGLFGAFGILLVWSIAYGIRQMRRLKAKALVPITINAIALLLLLQFPFLTVWLRLNFAALQSARTEVVSLVQSGQLSENETGQIELPLAYRLTSEGGQITQENGDVLFYTFRGIDNYAGFVHVADAAAPAIGAIKFYGKVIEVEPFQPHWYWISAT